MRVRLTQQLSGDRAPGQPWPAAGEEIDLPDSEARGMINAGTAVDPGYTAPTVLVPPAGVHTPGAVLHADGTAMVRAPADALADPEGTRRAVADAAAGNHEQVSRELGFSRPDGSALTDADRRDQAARQGTKSGTRTPDRSTVGKG